jgi:hypothetical protein
MLSFVGGEKKDKKKTNIKCIKNAFWGVRVALTFLRGAERNKNCFSFFRFRIGGEKKIHPSSPSIVYVFWSVRCPFSSQLSQQQRNETLLA